MNERLRLIGMFATLSLVRCGDLEELPRDVCGNHIIEDLEDCDGAAIEGLACNASCRVECSADAGVCPSGWGCGTDGLCRQPSGVLEARGEAVALPADSITLADVDGDGRKDVIASQGSTTSIAFVDEAGFLPEVRRLTSEPIDEFGDRPGVGDLADDGLADLVVRVGEGLGVLSGSTDRTLLPFPFRRTPPDGYLMGDRLLAVDFDPRPEAPGDELLAIGDDGVYLLETYDEAVEELPIKVFSWPQSPVTPYVAVATLDQSSVDPMNPNVQFSSAPGLDLIVAFEGDNKVYAYDGYLFRQDSMAPGVQIVPNAGDMPPRPPRVINLPPGGVVRGQVQVGALSLSSDFDEFEDVLIPGELDGEPVMFVAFATGAGFSSSPNLAVADNMAGRLRRTIYGEEVEDPIFALGRFNLDSFVDFVDAYGIFVSNCSLDMTNCPFVAGELTIDYTELAIPDGLDGWTNAYVLAGGQLDFFQGDVLTTSTQSGFTFFKRGEGGFARFQFATSAPVQNVDFGDFNGDGARDLVFTHLSTRRSPQNPDLQALFISFGDALGLPTAPVDLGDVGKVSRVFRGRVPDITEFPDTVDDIYALTEMGDEYFLFRGSTDRNILSPLDLELVCEYPPYGAARSFAVGDFEEGAARELAVLFQDLDLDGEFLWELWSVRPDDPRTLAVCDTAVGPAFVEDPGSDELRIVALDLEGDGTEEVAILPVGTSSLIIGRLSDAEWQLESVPLPGVATSVLARSLDGDAGGLILWSAEEVFVLEADGDGGLATAGSLTVGGANCPSPLEERPIGPVRDVAAIRLEAGASRDLLVLTPGNVLRVDVTAEGSLVAKECLASLFEGGGSAIAADDLDGDGVEDVVIARAGGTRLFAGLPVVP